jgi:hypothetical protein
MGRGDSNRELAFAFDETIRTAISSGDELPGTKLQEFWLVATVEDPLAGLTEDDDDPPLWEDQLRDALKASSETWHSLVMIGMPSEDIVELAIRAESERAALKEFHDLVARYPQLPKVLGVVIGQS